MRGALVFFEMMMNKRQKKGLFTEPLEMDRDDEGEENSDQNGVQVEEPRL